MSHFPDIHQLVEQLLKNADISSLPVKLSKIAKLWDGLQVTIEDIEGEAFLVDLGVLGSNILIKKNSSKERQRFSLAHELGHLALRDAGIPIDASPTHARDNKIERWCNEFAAELLMPTAWLRDDVLKSDISKLYLVAHELSQKYEVSHEAIFIRFSEIAPINIFRLIIRENSSFFKYNRLSREFVLSLNKYKEKILNQLSIEVPNVCFVVDINVYCILQAQYLKSSEQTWIGFLVRSKDGVTLDVI